MLRSLTNDIVGKISFDQFKDKDRLRTILQNPNIVSLSSISGEKGRVATEERIDSLYVCMVSDHKRFGLGFYEIYSDSKEFIGIAGFFMNQDKQEIFPEICYYILPEFQRKRLGSDLVDTLIEYAFASNLFEKIYADAFPENKASKTILEKRNFLPRDKQFQSDHRNYGQTRYELTRQNWEKYQLERLATSQKSTSASQHHDASGNIERNPAEELSKIILAERRALIPIIYNMANDMERTRRLWYSYFKEGVNLANGGVEDSILTTADIAKDNDNLYGFNMYRSDRSSSTSFPDDSVKKFLLEENLLSSQTNMTDISTTFCFGSHEGFTRLARCIYSAKNTGMIYPSGGYGFLACAAATMKPTPYSVYLANIDRDNGEKILVSDLERLVKEHPKAKTLYLEAKTTCGAVYKKEELEEIIKVCKAYNIFFILDTAHLNMEFSKGSSFPDITVICQEQNYRNFAILYTASKTYGFERARVGWIIVSNPNLSAKMSRDLYRVNGSAGDLYFEAAKKLMHHPVEERMRFISNNIEKHKLNMNIMIAYIEGVNSENIDQEFKEQVKLEIPTKYHDGIRGLKIVYKPEGGIQMKVDMSELQNKYFLNIRMFNSEIFYYTLNKMTNVVALHSYQIMDCNGLGMRLSFSIRDDIHKGMRRINDFVQTLCSEPSQNKFMPDVELAESFIFPTQQELEKKIVTSREEAKKLDPDKLLIEYKTNVTNIIRPFFYIRLSDQQLMEAVDLAALKIQSQWKAYLQNKNIKSKSINDGIVK